jgi:hypothetical protein
LARPKDAHPKEILFELRSVGRSVRVVAIDPLSGIEVTMVAPRTDQIEGLKRMAARKLAYVLAKRQNSNKD